MTAKAEKFIELLAQVREASFQDGRAMNDPQSTPETIDATLRGMKDANYALIMYLKTMSEEDLKSL